MIDISDLRENPEKYKKVITARQMSTEIVDKLLAQDKKRRVLIAEVDELRKERNKAAKDQDREAGKKIKDKLQDMEPELRELEEEYQSTLNQIPNLYSSDTPEGKDESENKVIRSWGTPNKFDFDPKDHLELGRYLRIIDVDTAAAVSGARFSYLVGDGAMLEFALIQFALTVLTDKDTLAKIAKKVGKGVSAKPFVPVIPPVFVKEDVFGKMHRLEPKEERYYFPKDELYLIGSAEHTLGPMHMNQTLSVNDLPVRYVGFSTSFRREAGSYGQDTRGILRVHQFDKLEMESFVSPESGEAEQDFFVAIQEHLMQELGIPYQIMAICTGDLGKPDFRQIDLNSWLPGQDKYRETHTADYMTDFQARRLNTKVQLRGSTEYVHMNDATAFAIGRTIIAILENYQQEDGSVIVPKVLQKYMGKKKITAPQK